MPAFSPTSAFKEAAGFNREMGAWSFQQFKDWLDRANQSGAISAQIRDQILGYAQDQIAQGYASPDDIRAIANQIVPGVEEALQRRQDRLGQIQDRFNNRVPIGETLARLNENQQGSANDISYTGEANQGEIDSVTGRAFGREDDTTNRIQGQIRDSYGRMEGGVNDTFGGLRRRNDRVGGDILSSLNRAYSGLRDDNADTTRRLQDRSASTTGDLVRGSDATFNRIRSVGDSTYGGIRGSLGSTVSDLETGNRGTYGDLLARLGNTYRDLNAGANETFDSAIKDAERLGPTGDALAARVGRSFAPAKAAAMSRLRRAGVDVNDPQYDAVMRNLEADQARAMDDSMAGSAERSVDRVNQLRLGRQDARERLGLGEQQGNERLQTALRTALDKLGWSKYTEGRDIDLSQLDQQERTLLDQQLNRQGLTLNDLERQQGLETNRLDRNIGLTEGEQDRGRAVLLDQLNREVDLASGQNDRVTNLGREAGDLSRGETLRNLGAQQEIDASRSNATINNTNQQFDRTQQWRNQGNQIALLDRAMQNEDFQTAANILQMLNGEELTAMDVRNMAYERGNDWVLNNYARRDAGAANLANIYAREQQQQNNAANIARGFGQDAASNYARTYEQEAGKGGWGTRLLVGAGSAALNYFVPGAGDIVGGLANNVLGGTGAMGGGGRSSGGGGGGGGRPVQGQYGQNSNPYNFGWQMPNTTARTPPFVQWGSYTGNSAPQQNYWTQGQMQPDGSFRIGRG